MVPGQIGDVIVNMDGTDMHRLSDLFKVLDGHKIDDAIVNVVLDNQGNRRTVKVTLQASP